MARPDENPIKPSRDVSADFERAANPPPERPRPEAPELAYKPPEPSGPGLGSSGSQGQQDGLSRDADRTERGDAGSSASKSIRSLREEDAKRLIIAAFNRRAKDKDNENER